MADFTVSDDVRMIQGALRDFIAREVVPHEKRLAKELSDERFLLGDDGFVKPQVMEAVRAIRRKSAALGLYAMHMPVEEGGGGVSKQAMYEAWREVMRHGLGLNLAVLSFVEGPYPLFLRLDDAMKKRYLHPLVRGEKSSAFCLTEPGAGSDVGAIRATAVKKGGSYVLDGAKAYVTNGPYADFYQVFAKTDPAAGLAGISCFLVDCDLPGVSIGKSQLSLHADGAQCEVVFDGVEVPAENRVGDEGEGFALAIGNIGDTRVTIGGMCVGLAEFCQARAVEYAQAREAFGKPIGKLGQIQAMIADNETDIFAADNMLLRTSWLIDQGESAIKETSMVKVFATEMLFRVADRAIQIHGGAGLMRELPLERIFRFARVLRIPEGTSEVQRWTIAKTLGL
ncbi:MAG TPA: acyl-CoA dehydrogenase family protein [Candidatus Thermoplasmatota archaeon]|nr:acyl-CoA dehydrogenase family protein [Candidatus Thermoplasmatota archaeon]